MNSEQLAHMADVTRRYGRFRPCGAGLGVIWGGVLLGTLGILTLQWAWQVYSTDALAGQTFWRFMRDTPMTPPGWLQLAALLAPFVGWAGLVAIQTWVDGQFGAVTAEAEACARPLKGPRWMAPFMVMLMAGLLAGVLVWDGQLAAVRGVAGILAIGAWALVWGRRSRDQLTLLVMFAVSVPSIYVLAATDTNAKFTAGNLAIFATYFVLMLFLLLQGIKRFSQFVRVRADLMAMQPVDE
jgi:hypothetical protein